MEPGTTILCPRCEQTYYTAPSASAHVEREQLLEAPYPALSRMDNQTYICSPCGMDEAMRDFSGAPPISRDEWPVK